MITSEGYVLRPIHAIIEEIKQELIAAGYDGLNLEPESFEGHLIELVGRRVYLIEQKLRQLYNNTPATATGFTLDSFCKIKGITRRPASGSSVNLVFTGVPNTVIPAESLVKNNAGRVYKTLTEITLTTPCVNKIYIGFSRVPSSGTWTLDIDGTTYVYNFDSGDMTLHPRITSYTGSYAEGFVCILDTIASSVSVTGTLDATPKATLLEIESSSSGEVFALATEEGRFTSGAYSVVTSVGSPEGMRSVYNPEPATPGQDRETDEELYERFNSAGGILGGSLDGIELKIPALIHDPIDPVRAVKIKEHYGAGPSGAPSPLEIFIDGGTTKEQEIAELIRLELLSGGIETVGDLGFTVYDSSGEAHSVYFSRPTQINVYVNIKIKVDPSAFTGGVKEAIVNWGNSLGFGKDVILTPGLVSSFAFIPGIVDVPTLEVSTDGVTYTASNIPVDSWSVSVWGMGNIDLTVESI